MVTYFKLFTLLLPSYLYLLFMCHFAYAKRNAKHREGGENVHSILAVSVPKVLGECGRSLIVSNIIF